MPWQRLVADVALEVDPVTGEWAYPIVVVTVPRQAGKTTLVGPVNLLTCLTQVDALCWYTAQTRADARDNWLEVAKQVSRSALGGRVKVRRSNGSEALEFPTGGAYRVFSPSEDALHGRANRRVTVDEAWAFDSVTGAGLEQAILPTFTTTAGQLWVVSTAGTANSTWLRGYVERGRQAVELGGAAGPLAYFEWSMAEDADPTDLDQVLAAHPAAGHTLKLSALRSAAATMPPGEFARAYGNRWTAAAEQVIPAAAWATAADPDAPQPQPGGVALAFDVGLDGTDAAIAAAWTNAAGQLVAEVIEHRAGAGWLVGRLAELAAHWQPRAILHDPVGPARAHGDAAARAGLVLAEVSGREYATACAALLAGVVEDRIRHVPHPALDEAVRGAVRRPLGDAWAWGRRQSASSIAPLVTVTLATWAYEHAPQPPAPFKII